MAEAQSSPLPRPGTSAACAGGTAPHVSTAIVLSMEEPSRPVTCARRARRRRRLPGTVPGPAGGMSPWMSVAVRSASPQTRPPTSPPATGLRTPMQRSMSAEFATAAPRGSTPRKVSTSVQSVPQLAGKGRGRHPFALPAARWWMTAVSVTCLVGTPGTLARRSLAACPPPPWTQSTPAMCRSNWRTRRFPRTSSASTAPPAPSPTPSPASTPPVPR